MTESMSTLANPIGWQRKKAAAHCIFVTLLASVERSTRPFDLLGNLETAEKRNIARTGRPYRRFAGILVRSLELRPSIDELVARRFLLVHASLHAVGRHCKRAAVRSNVVSWRL